MTFLLLFSLSTLCSQAAIDAGHALVWSIDVSSSAAGPRQLQALLDITKQCLAAEPSARPTTTALITALSQVKAGATLSPMASTYDDGPAGAGTATPAVTRAPPVTPSTPSSSDCYDVLAIIDTMRTLGLSESLVDAVSDAIGHKASSPLDVLKACGLPALKTVSVKKALVASSAGSAGSASEQVQRGLRVVTLHNLRDVGVELRFLFVVVPLVRVSPW